MKVLRCNSKAGKQLGYNGRELQARAPEGVYIGSANDSGCRYIVMRRNNGGNTVLFLAGGEVLGSCDLAKSGSTFRQVVGAKVILEIEEK